MAPGKSGLHVRGEGVTFYHKGDVICISEVIDISPGILIPACASSSPAFLMMYSAIS